MFKNSYTSRFQFWSFLSAVTVVFSSYFVKVSRKWSEEASIFSKLQVYENIREGFFLFNIFKSRSVFKPSQTSTLEVIAKILDVSKSFDYFFKKLHLRCLDEFCSFLLFYTIAVKTAIYCPEFNLEKKCNKPLIKGVTLSRYTCSLLIPTKRGCCEKKSLRSNLLTLNNKHLLANCFWT